MASSDLEEEIRDAFFVYAFTEEYISDLRKEGERIKAMLMPRSGSSLAMVTRDRGGAVTSDPTGEAAARIACHPLLKKIDLQIEYWRRRKRFVDLVLEQLSERERQVAAYCYFHGAERPEKVTREELRCVRRLVVEAGERVWGVSGCRGD